MSELILIIVIFLIYYSSYYVSLFSLTVYVDPEEVVRLSPLVSAAKIRMVEKMSGDSRMLMHISEIYKSFSLIVLTVICSILIKSLSQQITFDYIYLLLLGLMVTWFLYLSFAEFLPRSNSRRGITVNMISHLWLIYLIYIIFVPIIKIYRAIFRSKQDPRPVTEEEKEDIVERAIETVAELAGIDETIVDEEEKEMIAQIFQLDQTIVKEIMIPRIDIVGFEKDMSFKEIREIIFKDGHSRYPVYDKTIDTIIGLVYVKDLFNKMPEPGEPFVLASYLREPYLVPELKIIGELLSEFQEKRLHISVVVDEYGGVAGLVTLEDIIEEIVGEIQDEHDSEEDEVITLRRGLYKINSSLLLEDLQDHFETEFEQGEYDTVGGLIYDLEGSVPDEGRLIKWNSYEFEIAEIEGQRIKTIKVRIKSLP